MVTGGKWHSSSNGIFKSDSFTCKRKKLKLIGGYFKDSPKSGSPSKNLVKIDTYGFQRVFGVQFLRFEQKNRFRERNYEALKEIFELRTHRSRKTLKYRNYVI